jgi:hypothetical protein
MSDALAKLLGGIDDLRKRLDALESQESTALQKSAPELRVVGKSDDGRIEDDRGAFIKGLVSDSAVMDSLVKQARHASEQR